MAGRKSIYTKELAAEICKRIISGESMRNICKDPHTPCLDTLYTWLAKPEHPFADQYMRARAIQADVLAEQVLEIADECETLEQSHVAKVRIDARKWWAGKVRPKVYGADKVNITNNVATTNNSLTINRTREEDEAFLQLQKEVHDRMPPVNGDKIGGGLELMLEGKNGADSP